MLFSRPTRKRVSLRDISVLIVDDSIVVRNLIKWTLRSGDAGTIREAADGRAALKRLERFLPDVILVNWRTKPVAGLDFVRQVRNSGTGGPAFARIVVMSRCCRYRQVLAARDAGVDEFLVKPLSRAGLLAGIRTVIDNPRRFSCAESYFGPDRRRNQFTHDGAERRKTDETIVLPGRNVGQQPWTEPDLSRQAHDPRDQHVSAWR